MWTRLQCNRILLLVFNWRVTRLEMISSILLFDARRDNCRNSTDMAINRQYHQVIIREIFACGIQNPRKFCLWNLESRALESKIQLKESGIPLTIGIQNPRSTVKDWNLVPGIRNPRRGFQDPRDQDCLRFPFTGWHIFYFHCLVFNFSRHLKKLLNKE